MDAYASYAPSNAWEGNRHSNMDRGNHQAMVPMSLGASGSVPRDSSRTNLIVNYLPNDMTEKELYAMFVTVGPIESCRVMKDFKTGYSFGYGFVNYLSDEHAMRAIVNLNGLQVQNKRIKVSLARPASEDIKDTNLYVTNLSRTITEGQLDVIFGKYGHIVQKHILRDKMNGQPRGVAFVRFDKREEAQEAISALNNVIPEGGTQPLNVRLADEPNKQQKMVQYPPSYHMPYPHSSMNRGFPLNPMFGNLPQMRSGYCININGRGGGRGSFSGRSDKRYNPMLFNPPFVPYNN